MGQTPAESTVQAFDECRKVRQDS